MQTPIPCNPWQKMLVAEVVDAGADLFLQCACYHRTTYPSQVWESMWDEYRARGTSYGGQGWIEVARQGLRLEEQGVDFLGRARPRRGLRGDDPDGRPALPRTGFDRAHYLGLIRELIARYDFDVLSLDYVRHPPFFDRGQVEHHGKIMTDFLREVRRLCTAGGRRTAILARVPATPANCRELGLDVGAWARAGLVHGLALGMKNCTGWETPVDAFRAEVGPAVARRIRVRASGACTWRISASAAIPPAGTVSCSTASTRSWSTAFPSITTAATA